MQKVNKRTNNKIGLKDLASYVLDRDKFETVKEMDKREIKRRLERGASYDEI